MGCDGEALVPRELRRVARVEERVREPDPVLALSAREARQRAFCAGFFAGFLPSAALLLIHVLAR